jgi:hypothetical protein
MFPVEDTVRSLQINCLFGLSFPNAELNNFVIECFPIAKKIKYNS